MIRQIHHNSLLAYETIDTSERNQSIYGVYENSEVPLMDREVMHKLGFRDPNAVRPRITEMIDEGLLKEVGKSKDPVTNRTVRLVRIRRPEENLQPELF